MKKKRMGGEQAISAVTGMKREDIIKLKKKFSALGKIEVDFIYDYYTELKKFDGREQISAIETHIVQFIEMFPLRTQQKVLINVLHSLEEIDMKKKELELMRK